jgi:hypothetical protein
MSCCVEQSIPSLVSESRRAQGLPEHVEDPAALGRVPVLLRAARQRQIPEGPRQHTAGQAAALWPAPGGPESSPAGTVSACPHGPQRAEGPL